MRTAELEEFFFKLFLFVKTQYIVKNKSTKTRYCIFLKVVV